MDFSRLRHFYYVAKTGSLTKASTITGVDYSTLSKSMKIFEHSVKAKLFERESRGLRLTPQGVRIFNHASMIMQETDQFLREFHDVSDKPQGELKIATTPGTAIFLLSFLEEFLRIYPDVKISLQGVYDNIDLDHADVIVRPFMPNHKDLVQVRLLEYTIGLFASEKYIAENGKPSTLEDLKKHRLIGYNDKRLWQYAQFYWVNQLGEKPWELDGNSIEVSSAELAITAAEQGLGIAELAREFKNIRSRNLIEIFPNLDHPVGELYYIYRKEYSASKRVSAFGEFIKHKIENNRE